MDPLTILHLTDLHFGCDASELDTVRRQLCLNSLVRAVDGLESDWRPKVLCITGDIGWRGARTDYDLAKKWLERLLKTLGLGFQDIFVCAGNHDIIRSVAQTIGRPRNATEADPIFSNSLGPQYASAFSALTDFCKEAGIHPYRFIDHESYLMGECTFHGVRFLALNSAWFCKGDDDKNKLWVGLPQLQRLESSGQLHLREQSDCPTTVALVHHPADWWHEEETNAYENRPNTRDYLAYRAHLILTGHTHGEVRLADRIAGAALHMTGGSAYSGAGYFNAFRLIRVEDHRFVYRSFEFDPRSPTFAWSDRWGAKVVSFVDHRPPDRTQVAVHEVPRNHSNGSRNILKAIVLTLVALALMGFVAVPVIPLMFGKPKESEKKTGEKVTVEEFKREFDRIIEEAHDTGFRTKFIRVLTDGINRVEQMAESMSEPEVDFRMGQLYKILEDAYDSESEFEKACKENERVFWYFKRIYDREPLWCSAHPESFFLFGLKRNMPIAYLVAENRIDWAINAHARYKGGCPTESTRRQVEKALEDALLALRKPKETDPSEADRWLGLSCAFWANGNFDLAESVLEEASRSVGDPGSAGTKTNDRNWFHGIRYLLLAALQAERKSCKEAIASIEQGKNHVLNSQDDHGTVKSKNGTLGYFDLLVARALMERSETKDSPEAKNSLETAYKLLHKGHDCAACRYNLACVLAKKSQLENGAARDDLVRDATDQLLKALDLMKTYPFEPKIDAIKNDPFLKDSGIVNQEHVQKAMKDFQWDSQGNYDTLSTTLSTRHWGIPIKAIRFTRLAGDKRGF